MILLPGTVHRDDTAARRYPPLPSSPFSLDKDSMGGPRSAASHTLGPTDVVATRAKQHHLLIISEQLQPLLLWRPNSATW
ncbi:hypothetical protein BTVI_64990 [Pitangus sulphuratus]|nr:hypothetical protein BTVI_64990 [Pitangus sulphuratus]